MAAIANTLFFEAATPDAGEELWVYTTRGSTTTGYPRSTYSVRATGTAPAGTVVLKKGSVVAGRGVLTAGAAKIRITAYYAGSLQANPSHSGVFKVRVR